MVCCRSNFDVLNDTDAFEDTYVRPIFYTHLGVAPQEHSHSDVPCEIYKMFSLERVKGVRDSHFAKTGNAGRKRALVARFFRR